MLNMVGKLTIVCLSKAGLIDGERNKINLYVPYSSSSC